MSANYSGTQLVFGNGKLTLGTEEFACLRYYSTFQLNSIPFCKAVVVPESKETYPELYTKLNAYTPGDVCTLEFPFSGRFASNPSHDLAEKEHLTGQNITVFNGRFLGWSPVLNGDLLEVTIWMLHDLTMLDWSSSIVDEIHGKSLGDPLLKMTAVPDESIVPFMPEPYEDNVTDDIWENLIKKELLKLAQYKRFTGPNYSAETVLNDLDISADELPLSLTVSNAKRAIIDVRRTLYTPGGGNTLWDKLIQLADRYLFAVSPRIDGFSVIPYTPLLKIPAELPVLQFQQFMTENNFVAYVGRYFDAAQLVEGISSYSNPFDIVGRKPKPDDLRQQYSYGNEFYATGMYKAPAWTQVGNDLSYFTKATTGIDGSIRAAGYAMKAALADTNSNTPNKTYNGGGLDAENFAKAILNDELFKQRTCYLKSSMRFDIAPGNLIAVENPRGTTGEAGYYGTVHTVCSAISAGVGYSGTWVILNNVRTQAEQDDVGDSKHPLYNNTWISAPILDPAKNSLAKHVPAFMGEE